MPFTFRPPTFIELPHERLALELDRHLPRLYDAHNALDGQAIKAPSLDHGFGVQSGETTFTGTKLGIATGLALVDRVVASVVSRTATNITVTAIKSQTVIGGIDLYAWQPTGTADTTPIAATAPVTAHWWASGTAKAT